MDVSKIFNGADDLFKFMVIGGGFLLVFGLMYPLDKEKELKIQINELNSMIIEQENEDSLLNHKFNGINKMLESSIDSVELLLGKEDTLNAHIIRNRAKVIANKSLSSKNKLDKSRRGMKSKRNEVEILIDYIRNTLYMLIT